MELVQYIRLFKKWAWLILLAAFLAGGVSFIVRTGQPSTYEAATIIAIGRYIEAPNPNSTDIRTGIDLAQTYAELVTTYDVLQGTIDALDLPLEAEQLAEMIDTQILAGTSLLTISVNYIDPVLTADIANGLADQLIANSPTNLTEEQLRQIALLNEQIEALNSQLEESRSELTQVNSELTAATTSADIARLTSQRNTLVNQINDAASTVAQFSGTIAELQQRTNALDIVERARIPTSPTGATPATAVLLGALVGATLAAGLALLIEYIDDRIRSSDVATALLGLPVLGVIARYGKKRQPYSERLITHPRTPNAIAESYRALRTNLLFSGDKADKVYVVTSPGPVEGKSTTSANLAISFAQAGIKVLLIDADLRRPMQHSIFGLDNNLGLTSLLFADPVKANVVVGGSESHAPLDRSTENLRRAIQDTHVPNLRVITSGFIPSNPAEVLGSGLMQKWIDTFRASPNVDLVIVDTPPGLVVTDSFVLAGGVKANVILVLDAERTRQVAALKVKEQFEQVGVPISGVVLNRVNPRNEDYGYGYGYGYYYETPTANSPSPNGRHLVKQH